MLLAVEVSLAVVKGTRWIVLPFMTLPGYSIIFRLWLDFKWLHFLYPRYDLLKIEVKDFRY